MKIELINESKSVSLTLGENFRVLIGMLKDVNRHSLVLLSGSDPELSGEEIEGILKSGVRVGFTYPTSLFSLGAKKLLESNETSHLFNSFNEPWKLPFGWIVYPVSSGSFGTNWLLRHEAKSQAVLVCAASTVTYRPNSLYRDIYIPPQFDFMTVTDLVHLRGDARSGPPLISMNELKEILVSEKHISVQVRNGVEAVALAVACSHFLASLEKADVPVVSINGDNLRNQVDNVSSLFEWLSEDLQTYLMKCVKYVSDRNIDKLSGPFALIDLVEQKRLVFDQPNSATLSISLTSPSSFLFNPFPSPTTADLAKLYSPHRLVN